MDKVGEERWAAKITIAMALALKRPGILKYLRDQILSNTAKYIDLVTEEEIDQFLRTKDIDEVINARPKST